MKFMFLIYVDEKLAADADPGEMDAHLDFAKDALRRGAYVSCDALKPPATATTVRVRGGETIIADGPFAETREVLGGFYFLECASLDEAIRYAERIPPAKKGSIEIREIQTIPGWDEAMQQARDALTPAAARSDAG